MKNEELIIDLLKESREVSKELGADVSRIKSDIAVMRVDIHRNADDLELHMQRTDLNEKRISLVEDVHAKRMKSIEEKLTVTYLLKLTVIIAGGVGTIVGAAYGIIKIIDFVTN